MDRILKILFILQKYTKSEYFLFAEHDVIGFMFDYDLLTEEDEKALNDLSVFYDYEYNAYVMYV